MSKVHTLQEPFLNALRKERIPVSIYLVNGIKLQGQIESFDSFVVLLKNSVSQIVYKHAISTIVPARAFFRSLGHLGREGGERPRLGKGKGLEESRTNGLERGPALDDHGIELAGGGACDGPVVDVELLDLLIDKLLSLLDFCLEAGLRLAAFYFSGGGGLYVQLFLSLQLPQDALLDR